MIPLFKVLMGEYAKALVEQTLESGYIGEGPRVAEFEKKFAQAVGVDEVLAVNSCTSALDLALHLCGVGPGDRVLTTAMTCSATNTVIVRRGAIPVWCDVRADSGLIDPEDARHKLTSDTKAVVAVNWGGALCNYTGLRSLGVPIIEDAAHNLRPGGGDYICWSFQAIKFLTTGDGGALHCPPEQRERARLLRWYGLDRQSSADFRCAQNIGECGYKYHMNDIAASIGIANLWIVDGAVDKHRANAAALKRLLQCQSVPWTNDSPWWLYTILVENRDQVIKLLAERGVASSPVHARNDKHTAMQRAAGRQYRLPGLDRFASRNLAIPVGWWLSAEDVATVAIAVNEAVAVACKA